jgi:hypothetical protein
VPLLDHFDPAFKRSLPWRSFHGSWAHTIARRLNEGVLPPHFYALPFLDGSGPIEIDVATFGPPDADDGGGWQPEWGGAAVAVEWPPVADDAWVEIRSQEGDPPLVAAIELVSPANKDRPATHKAFAGKCAGYLRGGCGLVTVDVVTTRRADLHAELLAELGVDAVPSAGGLAAVAYRPVAGRLEFWPAPLAVGQPLPEVPLWLRGDRAVPLDLEASYRDTCVGLRLASRQ